MPSAPERSLSPHIRKAGLDVTSGLAGRVLGARPASYDLFILREVFLSL